MDVETPARIDNPPGQSAIAYRVGAHGQFKESLLARLSSAELPALAGLGARDDGDFTIALCDALATTLDVLAFYQERIANENYLRTATERRSILELARLIGYELAPGVAASTFLAFTLQEVPGSPALAAGPVEIPVGAQGAERSGAGRAAADLRDRGGGRGARRMERHSGADHPRLASRISAIPSSGSPAWGAGCSRAMRS